jgi:thymidylate synthase
MNHLDKNYQNLLQDILTNGVKKEDRTGTGTISVFGRQIRHNMRDGFPLLTTKKMSFKNIAVELLWFLRGDTNIKFLVNRGCNIWNGDAYKNYRQSRLNDKTAYTMEEFVEQIKVNPEFAHRYGELGPIYGKQWRVWNSITKEWWSDPEYQGYGSDSRSGWNYEEIQIDQIQNLINDLKTNPDSRRLMVSAWNVGELDQMVLPPCHYGFQVYTRELSHEERCMYYVGRPDFSKKELDRVGVPTRAISLMWNQRSCDLFLGIPYNIASYGLLLEIIAKHVNMIPDELIGNLGDTHLYLNHLDQATKQISRDPYNLPTLNIASGPLDDIAHHEIDDFDLLNYKSHPAIKAPLSN